MIRLTSDPLDPAAVEAAVLDPACGGVVVFIGRVRDHHRGHGVDHLSYEAYEEMAVAGIETILGEVRERWGIDRVAVAHRLGRLEIGDAAVVIAVAAGHRAEAFEACRYVIDRLKDDVPIWKHETFTDGSSEWVGPEGGG